MAIRTVEQLDTETLKAYRRRIDDELKRREASYPAPPPKPQETP